MAQKHKQMERVVCEASSIGHETYRCDINVETMGTI